MPFQRQRQKEWAVVDPRECRPRQTNRPGWTFLCFHDVYQSEVMLYPETGCCYLCATEKYCLDRLRMKMSEGTRCLRLESLHGRGCDVLHDMYMYGYFMGGSFQIPSSFEGEKLRGKIPHETTRASPKSTRCKAPSLFSEEAGTEI